MLKKLVFFFCSVGCLTAFATSLDTQNVQAPSSPCYSQNNIQKQLEQREMLNRMREMRPGANAQIQQYNQQQSQQQMTNWQEKANTLLSPYLNRAYDLQRQASSCRSKDCAAAIANQASALSNDVINNLLPKIQSLVRAAQQEMANAAKMPLSRLDELYKSNSGQSLPSSRSDVYFPPLCTGFQPQSAAQNFFDWQKLQRAASPELKNIREWNDKNSTGLGEWACAGSLAMGNVRCFKREANPNGNGQSCEKVKDQITACYDSISLWTPINSAKNTEEASWASWFDKPPKILRVMAGSIVMEEQNTAKIIQEKQKEVKDMEIVAPLLRSQEFNEKAKAMTEPPVPRWDIFENKILSGKGLSPEDIKMMTESDWVNFHKLQIDIQTKSDRGGFKDVVDQGVGVADQQVEKAAQWTKKNEENITSATELLENMAFISAPVAPEVAAGLKLSAKTATVATRILLLRADDSSPEKYAKDLTLLIGKDQIKELGLKQLTKIIEHSGVEPILAERITDNIEKSAEYLGKSKDKK